MPCNARERRPLWGGRFVVETAASVEAAFACLGESAARVMPRALAASVVIGAFWLFARLVRPLLRSVFRRVVDDLTVESLEALVETPKVAGLGLPHPSVQTLVRENGRASPRPAQTPAA